MARRRTKKRTQQPLANGSAKSDNQTPKSMVIRIGAGEVGPSVSQLVKDTREMMEPHTASRLKERKSNKLRDFTTMCGPLGVTHLLLFSRSEKGNTNLRLAVAPRGPTLQFRVEKYSLCKDVLKAQKHPRTGMQLHQTPPLVCWISRPISMLRELLTSL
jgi:ribosome biogenesis protein SSF1/2